jgi:hypothetical protein
MCLELKNGDFALVKDVLRDRNLQKQCKKDSRA